MRRSFKIEGIVLKKKSLLGKDLIVTFLTKSFGKVNVFAKGVKKITSRRLPYLDTGNLIKAIFYKRDDYFYLQEVSLVSGFSQIKKEPEKMKSLYNFFFVLDRLLPENQKEEAVYRLSKKFLIDLSNQIGETSLMVFKYLNRLMRILGYFKQEESSMKLRQLIEEIIGEKIPTFRYNF